MRKKILTVLLALCMVISLLPIAAFAAQLTEAQIAELKARGYTDEQIEEINKQIASYESDEILLIFEDTTISADEARLVIVAAPKASVTVKGAKLETGIVVAPGAAEAKVVLTEGAEVNAVVVLDKADVVVEKGTKATFVTVAETAEKSTVSVAGTVGTMDVDASNTVVAVANGGSVDTVTVGEKATETEINAASGATVGEVVDPAGNNTGTTAPAPTPTPAPAPSTPAETETDPEPEPDEGPVPTAKPDPAKLQANQIKEAPLADHSEPPVTGDDLEQGYKVEAKSTTAGKINVVFSGEVAKHENDEGITEAWVGLAIPKKSADGRYDYSCYLLRTKTAENGTVTAMFGKLEADGVISEGTEGEEDYIQYDTYYFNALAAQTNWDENIIYVVATPADGVTDSGIETNTPNADVAALASDNPAVASITPDPETSASVADQVQEIKDTMGNANADSVVGELNLNFNGVTDLNAVPSAEPTPEVTPSAEPTPSTPVIE